MRTRALAILLAAGLVAVATAPVAAQEADGRYRGFGDPGGFDSIVPPGQDGVLNAAEIAQAQAIGDVPDEHFDDQLAMYAGIIRENVTPGFAPDDVDQWFKDASFGVKPDDVARTYHPGGRDDVVVLRDASFGVPHIFGDTREGTMFAQGYATAEDRLFLMDVLRHVGRAELSRFLGPSPGNLAMDADQLAAAPYTEQDLVDQVEALRTSPDPVLRQAYADGKAYIAGINQYVSEAVADPTKLPGEYAALQRVPEQFVPADLVAIASLVGGIFGKGGGREVANFCGIESMAEIVGDGRAREIFADMKFADDPEAPVTAREGTFPYMQDLGPVEPESVPNIDCDSLQPIQPPPPDPTTVDPVELVPSPPLPALPGTGTDGDEEGGLALPGVGADTVAPSRTGTIDFPWGSVKVRLGMGMSNALLVNADRTDSGNPIAVFGPQTGYFVPQLLVEKDVHGPGISARGVAFAGTDIYVQLGRGRDYAWSATSAGADLVDEWVLKLCEPNGGEPTTASNGYVHDGQCMPIETHTETFVAKPSAGGVPERPEDLVIVKHFERAAAYGPLTARGTLDDGTPIAIASQRSTYGQELRSAKGFAQINDPTFMTDGVDSFRQAMGAGVDYTFNWFYVDGDDVAYQHSCLCPRRADGTERYLPTWGTGQWDWTGDFLDLEDQPFAVNPDDGYITSWNNKQAHGFVSSDSDFANGPVYRSQMLDVRIEEQLAEGEVDVGEAVDVMALAATTDLRAQETVPLVARVMGDEAPAGADPRAQEMYELLLDWHADDLGHRRDHDGDGAYEHARAIAIMDAWWPLLWDAIFTTEGGIDPREALGFGIHDAPQKHQGSAFNGGGYSHPDKDLRQVLDDAVEAPFSSTYCGNGDLVSCREVLWSSLSDAADDLEEAFGSDAVSDWKRVPADDAIRSTAVGVQSVPPIDWQNRPTFQQVVQIPVHAGQPPPGGNVVTASAHESSDRAGSTRTSLPATGGGAALLALVALTMAATLRRRG